MDKAEFYRNARPDSTGPLETLRVVDCTTAWAGPMAGCLLADMGADVVHIDLPGGLPPQQQPLIGGTGLNFVNQTVNRNKRSLSLDLRTEAGQGVFLDLVATADVVVENFRPGTLDTWGIGYEHCRSVKPDIVYVSISGWGQFGPWTERAGYDPAALAAGGWMSLNGSPEGPPVKAPTFLADDLAGMHGALSALAALRHRDRTGEGQHVDVCLLDSLLFHSNGLLSLGATGVPLERWGSQVSVTHPCDVYHCRDGSLYLAIALDNHWRRLCEVIDRADLARAPGFGRNAERLGNRDAVNDVIRDWCANRSVYEALGRLLDAGLVAAKLNTYADAAHEPHVIERDMLQPTRLSDGSTAPLTGPAAKFSRTPTRVRHGARPPGTDNDDILAELGYDDDRREQLRAEHII
ncbi:MAG: CaiB/BaiF CoA-transferase family protein [Actinomycetota bacterium]|nr:CaiB/BaiF CoA-transferase family protein [Actinomycetota bacterium]